MGGKGGQGRPGGAREGQGGPGGARGAEGARGGEEGQGTFQHRNLDPPLEVPGSLESAGSGSLGQGGQGGG